jgi:hypothetical protein
MTPQLWIGVGFTATLIVFLMLTFIIKDTSSPVQYNTLRFLTSLCGGFAGGFLAGEALFSLDQQIADGTRLAISGTAGFAIMFTLWFTYPKRHREVLEDRIKISIPAGWTFEQAVRKIVQGVINFYGFKPEQLSIVLPATDIDAKNILEALTQLQHATSSLPKYRIGIESGIYHIHCF